VTRDEALIILARHGLRGPDAETALDYAMRDAGSHDPEVIAWTPLSVFTNESARAAVILRKHLGRSKRG
jgi:hypothetical protein